MSQSTTSTTTYNLIKYSRSYAQSNGESQQAEQEWQHFTNPVIRLVLDATKSSATGELEAFRLRVLWNLSAGPDAMDTDQRDVMFEDIDMLSLSIMQHGVPSQHGLPLKAVYRDSVVGIRYLHSRTGAVPSFRRFQVTFQSATLVSSFIDAIKYICPCKVNPPPPVRKTMARSTTMMPPPAITQAVSHQPPVSVQGSSQQVSQADAPRIQRAMSVAGVLNQPSTPATDPARHPGPPSQSPRDATPWNSSSQLDQQSRTVASDEVSSRQVIAPSLRRSSTALPSSAPLQLPAANNAASWDPPSHLRTLPPSDDYIQSRPSSAITASSAVADYSFHASSEAAQSERLRTLSELEYTVQLRPPAAIDLTAAPADAHLEPDSIYARRLHADIPPPLVPPHLVQQINSSTEYVVQPASVLRLTETAPVSGDVLKATEDTPMQDLITTLEEVPTLYNLPREELERLVARVVREEGFVKLLENLDSMWTIKSYLGRA
ncbi:hypothetical protein WOLCODRAFT_153494 [Wolfiporia cocos MD-104 SS10]|uniref:Uncharacterized protein n=1 Tax=Wolfiporia cocos (strain MD-104) TaxID=742152 RepID=A0A2H3K319_WOLCO|nr:hypothetical protein WOLCODRAFT_153494 [Wolfiporia cocos MD-104 SS10]